MQQHITQNNETGFIRAILLVIIALLILRFGFDFDVIEYVSGEEFQTFIGGVWNAVKIGWAFLLNLVITGWAWIISLFS